MTLPYLTEKFAGIGGTIKNRAEDFFVQEIPLYEPSGEGEQVYFEIQKVGITTFDAMHRLGAALRVREKDIGYAGLKDARAVTRQIFSITGTSESAVMNLRLPDITIQWAARHKNKLRLGHLAGNRFAIKVRDVRPTDVIRLRPMLNEIEKRGLPNFFGDQRFGRRGNNDRLGAALVSNDDQALLSELLGKPDSTLDSADGISARAAFDAGNFETAAAHYPPDHGLERRIISRLMKTGKPAAAVGAIDEKLRRLWVSALQSRIFNDVVARRIGSLDHLIDGDLAYLHSGGACFIVESAAVEQPRCDRFEISSSGPLIGSRMDSPRGEPLQMERDVLGNYGLTADMFRNSTRGNARGARRPMRVRPTDATLEAGVDEHGGFITVAFTLPAGAYATVLMGELMKTDSNGGGPGAPSGDEGSNAQEDEDRAEDGHEAETGSGD